MLHVTYTFTGCEYRRPRKPVCRGSRSAMANLPPGWTAGVAPDGREYYFNAATNESTYTHPGAADNDKGSLPSGWTEHKTPEGKAYYHNTATGVTSWDPPGQKKEEKQKKPEKNEGMQSHIAFKMPCKPSMHARFVVMITPKEDGQRYDAHLVVVILIVYLEGGDLPDGWKEFKTKDGKLYYHHADTGKTEWSHPGKKVTGRTNPDHMRS